MQKTQRIEEATLILCAERYNWNGIERQTGNLAGCKSNKHKHDVNTVSDREQESRPGFIVFISLGETFKYAKENLSGGKQTSKDDA